MRRGVKVAFLAALAAVLMSGTSSTAGAARSVVLGKIRIWKIAYRAHNGVRRNAFVAFPSWYRPGDDPPIPLVISPHGRGVTGRENIKLWGQLPAIGGFGVVSPNGMGRLLPNYSWGSTGQIADLARMPQIVKATLPWVHINAHRVYAVGGSMGGQETLLLVARHPGLLAGAAAFDPVVDFSMQYREFPHLGCSKSCLRMWDGPVGRSMQALARAELGGSPARAHLAYELRSPLTYVRAIAFSHVPLQLWWSKRDAIVIDQKRQTARLFNAITKLNPRAHLIGFMGAWRHSAEMHAKTHLPFALAVFGLLPSRYEVVRGVVVKTALPPRRAADGGVTP